MKLKDALAELRSAYHVLLQDFTALVKAACAIDSKLVLEEARSVIRGRCVGLDEFTIDPQCKAFIGRLIDPYGDETQWLVSLASFLARKPPEKWIDDDLVAAKYRLTELAVRVRDLRQLQLHYEDVGGSKSGDWRRVLSVLFPRKVEAPSAGGRQTKVVVLLFMIGFWRLAKCLIRFLQMS